MNTMQFEFDAVVAHLYKQGRPAASYTPDGPGCFYRTTTADGAVLACAVGCRIPDAAYKPEMDAPVGNSGTSLCDLLSRFRSELPTEITAYEVMFGRLQAVHDSPHVVAQDGTFDRENLTTRLASVAVTFELTFTVPTTQGA